ncbi:hypothetical protein LCGC14_1634070 [marine sediment metagenome]|uniref:GTP cyclohydrolase I n=1 Tax=marine sediment metagenome TaxID=412755 RepID=A0A0F9L1E2_9ZZZZ
MIEITWRDIENACQRDDVPGTGRTVFGVPRGGTHIAQALNSYNSNLLVDEPTAAEFIVDDIVDSGRTRARWLTLYPLAEFWAPYDKTRDATLVGEWLEFPWERHNDETAPEDSAARLLESLGFNLNSDGMKETPDRLVHSLKEMTTGYAQDPKEILKKRFDATYDEMVVVRDIEFYSLCEHHILPFHGTVTVGYLPGENVVGVSKLGRLVDCFARRLQLQERMTQQIAEAMNEYLQPRGVGCVVRATHLCMAMRGAKCPAEMVTSSLLGMMRDEAAVRAEFMSLAGV